jgi:hypothetical protein
MKKILITAIILSVTTNVIAIERKQIKDVDTDSLIADTQDTPKGAGENHAAMCWWIPSEFWQAILAKDPSMAESDKKAMLEAMSGVTLLAVVQADITDFGAFNFYPKDEIEKQMTISYTNAGDEKLSLSPMKNIKPDLEIVLGVFKPILGAAMGNLGNNMHFYVLNDETGTTKRLIDPYNKGLLNVKLTKRNGNIMNADIEMPLNSLFVPRKCPNGKDAHVSWNYCPWTGEKLED